MTWVVGMPTMFGYCAGVSDIQVSFGEDYPSIDCIQKVHPVWTNLALGFAGSVELGFRFIEDLRFRLRSHLQDGYELAAKEVVELWAPKVNQIFTQSDPLLQECGLSLEPVSKP